VQRASVFHSEEPSTAWVEKDDAQFEYAELIEGLAQSREEARKQQELISDTLLRIEELRRQGVDLLGRFL
jgi:hypothetical protein